ncbi:semaphorin-1A-like isoform X2 [Cloeon dipterum]
MHRFSGNNTHPDQFRLIVQDEQNLLVGGRNLVHNLTLTDLTEIQKLAWVSPDNDRTMCSLKGQDFEQCQNYIRVLIKISTGRFLICGTNAYNPVCRVYASQPSGYFMEREWSGRGSCPYGPNVKSTAVFVDGELYSGTYADFAGFDPVIFREPLRTAQFDSNTFNHPVDFVNSFAHGDYVYFFFREKAVECTNCGNTIYSIVARVCKSDKGYRSFTSFLKTRLTCSVPGEDFYFDQIESTSDVIEGRYGAESAEMVYAVFNALNNGSAVCAFRLQDISKAFDGPFAGVTEKVPDPRPGKCVNDSVPIPSATRNFIQKHPRMQQSADSFFGRPIVTQVTSNYRFTHIAVDPQVKTPGGKAYDVLFIGTDNGKVIKAVNAESADNPKKVNSVVIEEIQVFPPAVAITSLKIVRHESLTEPRLIVVSNSEIQSIKLHRCDSNILVNNSCSVCVGLQDPHCAWDKQAQKCATKNSATRWNDENSFYQSIATGLHGSCSI